MKKSSFLNKLKKERKLELVEISEEMNQSYHKKSKDSLQVAKLAYDANYYENAIGEAYYSMYNSVQSLLFKCGIKCENHTAASILLKTVFDQDLLHKTFTEAKEERIDKQYYVTTKQANPVTKDSCKSMISTAEKFILEIEVYKMNLKLKDTEQIRGKIYNI